MGESRNEGQLLRDALALLQRAEARIKALEGERREPIAVIGMACRFPGGATDPESFYELLREGRDGIGPVPADRWDADAWYGAGSGARGKIHTRFGGFVEGCERFDAAFFDISPREAESLDPQQRMLLEVSWEALERAGLAPLDHFDTRTGVFVGISGSDYLRHISQDDPSRIDAYMGTGNAHSSASGRLSYFFGFQGPCVSIDTACSSSLVALHAACQSLRAGESDMALAGGVNHLLMPDMSVNFSRAHMLAPDGRCKSFDASANGYVRAEGCGMVVLKRLSSAVAAGDPILAVIRGSAVNQDGRSSGLTVPNGPAQQAVIRDALKSAGLEPSQVSYIETHGTGTALGDPIEADALGAVFGARDRSQPLWIGSVKSNIGHLESAAGIASLIKTILCLQHRELTRTLHFTTPSPHIAWDTMPLRVVTTPTAWTPSQGRRIAGISSFSFSGTNAHVIIEEHTAPAAQRAADTVPRPWQGLALSARSEAALRRLSGAYARRLASATDDAWPAICAGAALARSPFEYRRVFVDSSVASMRQALHDCASGTTPIATASARKVGFLFTGQGSQYPNMSRGLYDTEPVFRDTVHRLCSLLDREFGVSLLPVLYPAVPPVAGAKTALDDTAFTQPALFIVEYALAELWKSWGVEPDAVAGHSVGEYVAAAVAGVFSAEDGLRLIAERARLLSHLPAGGGMFSVFARREVVEAAIAPHARVVSIAAVNGEEHVVMAGALDVLGIIDAQLQASGIRTRQLVVSHAFHSPLTDPILDPFRRAARDVAFTEPYVTFVSALTGAVESGAVCDPEYWVRHVRQPVLFHQALGALDAAGCNTLLEIGPQAVLSSLAEASPRQGRVCLPSLRRGRDDQRQILESLGVLFEQGVAVNWGSYFSGRAAQRTELPTYPFERKRHWFDPSPSRARAAAAAVERRFAIDGVVGGHRVFGEAIVPAAAFLDLALDAASREGRVIEDFRIHRALPVTVEHPKQVVMVHVDGEAYELRGRDAGSDAQEIVCASLRLVARERPSIPATSLEAMTATFPTEIPAPEFYARMRRKGFDYGESYRLIDRLWVREGAALARISRGQGLAAEPPAIDACTLDACFQTLLAVLPATDRRSMWLPVGIARLSFLRTPTPGIWCVAEVTSTGNTEVTARLQVLDDAGETVAVIEGMSARQASMREVSHDGLDLDDVLYRPTWVRTAIFDAHTMPALATIAPHLRTALEDGRQAFGVDRCGVGLAELNALTVGYIVAGLRGLGMRFEPGERVTASGLAVERHRQLVDRLLAIVAATGIVARDGTAWVVTRTPEAEATRAASVALRERYPEIAAEVVLTDRCGAALAEVLRGAVEPITELLFPSGEAITAASLFRDARASQALNQLIVSTLHRAMDALPQHRGLRILEVGAGMDGTIATVVPQLDPARTTYHLADVSRAMFTDIAAAATHRIRQQLAGFPSVSFHKLDLDRDPVSQGFATGSYDVVIAPNVLHAMRDVGRSAGYLRQLLAPGGLMLMIEGTRPEPWVDLVYGMTPPWWAFSDHDVRPDHPLAAPDQWAAVLQRVGFGAVESFVCEPLSQALIVASAPSGPAVPAREQVLVLADARGVGDQLAHALRQRGSVVTTVARTGDLRQVLAEIGEIDQCVMLWPADAVQVDDVPEAARELCAFALDVVQALASRSGHRVPRLTVVTRSAMSIGGERADGLAASTVWGLAKSVAAEHRELRVRCLDLPAQSSADDVSILLDELQAADEDQVAYRDGQRFAARLSRDAGAPDGEIVCAADATYIVTGGLGDLGLHAAGWLIDRGARHVTLVSRRLATASAAARIGAWREAGIDIALRSLDIADRRAVEALLNECARTLPRLAGVIHGAGVFDDGMLADVTADRLARVLAPKVDGAWHLHECTRTLGLDFFVLYSSAASLFGSAGQASYVSANAFLDALGSARRAEGLPATTINWAGWRQIGHAARSGAESLLRSRGIGSFSPAFASIALERAIASGRPHLAVVPVDWPQFFSARTSESKAFTAFDSGREQRGGAMPALFATLSGKSRADASVWLRQYVANQVASVLRLGSADDVPATRNFFQMGMDSLTSIELRNRLRDDVGQPLPATLAFDCPTVPALAEYLANLLPDSGIAPAPVARADSDQPLAPDDDAVAIIGMGCRFPGGADTPSTFFDHLRAGLDAISEVPSDRWDADAWFDPNPDMPGKINTRYGGFVPGCEHFDPAFFEISPREARSVDPQHRMLLEVSWEALENAGLVPSTLAGTQTGVFVGITGNDYYRMITETAGAQRIDAYLGTGNAHSAASGRLSYFFGFKGPCMSIDTACSSALVALHAACQSLRSGESEMALAGGVNHLLLPEMSVNFAKAHMLAPDGRCKAFDSRADGYVRSEGCGMVVLKRLSRALADGDPILAVIRGSAVNQDGQSGGLTVPNGPSQSEVIRRALAQARVRPDEVSYVEAHGTGTSLGDPIEVNALEAVFGERDAATPLWIGSVKSNLGHLESAAGVASVIKTVLCLQAGEFVPSLHCDTPNPHLDWQAMPIRVTTARAPWTAERRIAGVSSFSFSGTNAHVVIEQAPRLDAEPPVAAPGEGFGLALSAHSDQALRDMARRYADLIGRCPDDLQAICAAAAMHRETLDHRLFASAPNAEAMGRALDAFADGRVSEAVMTGRAHAGGTASTHEGHLDEIGRAFVDGQAVDWSSLYGSRVPHYAGLPNYPFQRQRHWYNAIDVCYRRAWDERSLDSAVATRPGLWLICADRPWPALARALEQAGGRVEYASAGTCVERVRDAEDLQGVVHMWQPEPDLADGREVAAVLHRLAMLARAAAARTVAPALWIATRHGSSVGQATVSAPVAPALAAMGRCLFLEYPAIKGGLVDVDAGDDVTAALLGAELLARVGEDVVALSGGRRFVSRLESYRPVETGASTVRRDGAYLISGGLGALGLEFARDLASRGAGAVILMGRSAPSEPAARAVARLEATGTRVLVAGGDVTDASAVAAAMALGTANGFALRGVIHAAGINERRAAADMSVDDIHAVLSAKAIGAWVLHQATADQRLDFFVLCSSITSVWGSTQQGHYAAANAALDGLAEYRRARQLPALSINWGPWAGAGMSMHDGGRRVVDGGLRLLAPADALSVLGSVLGSTESRLVVADVDWARVKDLYQVHGRQPLFERVGVQDAPTAGGASSLVRELERLPVTERFERLARPVEAAIGHVLGLAGGQSVEREIGFFDLGIDSLMSVQIKDRIQQFLGREFPASLCFDYPTVSTLVAHLLDELFAAAPEPPVRPAVPKARVDEREIQQLSDDQVAALIAEEMKALNLE